MHAIDAAPGMSTSHRNVQQTKNPPKDKQKLNPKRRQIKQKDPNRKRSQKMTNPNQTQNQTIRPTIPQKRPKKADLKELGSTKG